MTGWATHGESQDANEVHPCRVLPCYRTFTLSIPQEVLTHSLYPPYPALHTHKYNRKSLPGVAPAGTCMPPLPDGKKQEKRDHMGTSLAVWAFFQALLFLRLSNKALEALCLGFFICERGRRIVLGIKTAHGKHFTQWLVKKKKSLHSYVLNLPFLPRAQGSNTAACVPGTDIMEPSPQGVTTGVKSTGIS